MVHAGDYWARQVAHTWGRTVSLTPLPGEFDLNFQGEDVVLKVMRPGCDAMLVDLQVVMLAELAAVDSLPVPRVIPAPDGTSVVNLPDERSEPRLVWLLERLPGAVYAGIAGRDPALWQDVGTALALMHRALTDLHHPALDRSFKWNLSEAGWIGAHLALIDDDQRRSQLERLLTRFNAELQPLLERLPVQAIHNDLNDYNLLVARDAEGNQRLSGLIDFGDAQYAPVIADIAIAAAYLMLDADQPVDTVSHLVAAYCKVRPLSEVEIDALWPLALMRLAVSVVNSAIEKRARPDDPYVVISEAPAWRLLDAVTALDDAVARASLRRAAGLPRDDRLTALQHFLHAHRGQFAEVMGVSLVQAPVLDLSPTGDASPSDPLQPDADELQYRIERQPGLTPVCIGRYAEPRLIYSAPAFREQAHPASRRRTVHLGLDVFMAAGSPVHAPMAGTVCHAAWDGHPQDYGGLVVLEHVEPTSGERFHTLYGHLSKASAAAVSVGQSIAAGEAFAALGDASDNGHWPPHLHFQLGVLTQGACSWPGVVDADGLDAWQDVFPNPAALLNLPDAAVEANALDVPALRDARQARTVANLKTAYRTPLPIVRGWKQYLFDDRGRCYLDAYNNVPHVGHSHPRVVEAVSRQLATLNTNTRYLHPALVDYADALCSRLPDPLTVCLLVNSGSEANELALRLARACTGARDIVVSAHGYHGITRQLIDISHYKFAGRGGEGQSPGVHVAPVPDTYRGEYLGSDAGSRYADAVKDLLETLDADGRQACGFISEVFPSVGGQIIPPPGYLAAVYRHIRAHGGLAIADEVQTGLGRLGRYQWGFEQQQVVPDIVVLGKPIGNGYPLGAVITTRAIADAFDTGMELFSTFGGATAACVAGRTVLQVLDDEKLADNAAVVGERLLAGLQTLAGRYPMIGDVRGLGLFIGVELVHPDGSPATRAAGEVVNRLRDRRILIGSDGPFDNVLKIRPPLCFGEQDADWLVEGLGRVLGEVVL